MKCSIWFPTLEDVLRLHEIQINLYGGSHGVREIGLVESALMNAQQKFGGEDLYPTLSDKAAALWHRLVGNHAFVDGNKRIGLMVADVFITVNKYEFDFSDDEVEAITLKMASGGLSRQELSAMLAEHVVPKKYSGGS